jgi:hypothetical protein
MDLPWKEGNEINEGKALQSNQFTNEVSKVHKILWQMNALKLFWPIIYFTVSVKAIFWTQVLALSAVTK